MESLKDEGPLKSALADPPKNTASPFILVSASVLSRKHDSLYISSFISEIIQHCRVGTPMGILPPVRGNKPVRVVYDQTGRGRSESCSVHDGCIFGTNRCCFARPDPLRPLPTALASVGEIRITAGGGMIMIDGIEG